MIITHCKRFDYVVFNIFFKCKTFIYDSETNGNLKVSFILLPITSDTESEIIQVAQMN